MGTELFLVTFALFGAFLFFLFVIGAYKVFEKAGRPGWAIFIPIYNLWTLADIGDKPGWWGLVTVLAIIRYNDLNRNSAILNDFVNLFTLVGLVLYVIISLNVAKNFNRTNSFGVFLVIVPFVGYPMLAFGPSPYKTTRNKRKKKAING
jgi:hypothetical protein